jgi:hypothetical protein
MKLRPINIIEIILFFISVTGCLFHSAHIPYLNLVVFILLMFMGCLYWPLGFYTLRVPGVNIVYSIGAGLLFSVSLVQAMFSILKWPTFTIVFKVIIAIYLIVLLVILGVFVFKKQKRQAIKFDKGLLIRFVIYFLFVLYAFFNYRSK